MSKIKEIAKNNSVLNEEIEKSKQFFHKNKEKVEKQMRELVALYSIKEQKPFFFISPSEARLAIDYVKNVRNGFIQDKEDELQKDSYVRKFLENYEAGKHGKTFSSQDITAEYKQYGGLTLNCLNKIFTNMEKSDCITNVIIMNAERYGDIRSFGLSAYDQYTSCKVIKERGCFGKIWTAEIYVSKKIYKDSIVTIDTTMDKVVTNILSL